ncbi:MAG: NAD(P)/FAD-dependent oxidoreductase [Pleurocapsa minor GSE-CHR-MK-17-07R]|jgi:putative flavoprotein involved in K+ transport|nr:NAD(P)/FAD-dependent oxidoreductase [Pleurocapsa minor GSE-CHR-MK 17-07R]
MAQLSGDVLVIGAGPAGLAAAYYLERAGIRYTVVDRAGEVGATWAHLYPSLRLNTASFVTYLPGRRMPIGTPIYPSGKQLYDYIVDYARAHPFNIQLGVDVRRISASGAGWLAETSAGDVVFPCVIAATGRYSKPFMPDLPGREGFRGRILHAQAYRAASDYAGQRVLAVGAGPSGVDIALELVEHAAAPVYLSVRSDIVVARRYPYGLPDTAWHLIARSLLPRERRKPFLDKVLYQPFPDSHKTGLTFARDRTHRRGTSTPVRGRAVLDAIQSGQIVPVPGVARFHPHAVELADGSQLDVETVILSTGYRPALDYLDIETPLDAQWYPVRRDNLDEGGSTEIASAPGIYLVGRYYRGLGPLNNIRHEAKRAIEEISARLANKKDVPAHAPSASSHVSG